jgi:hypothetical protein
VPGARWKGVDVTSESWVLIVAALPLGGYGILNILRPDMTRRWQRSSAEKARQRGDAFGTIMGDRSGRLVGDELPSSRRRVRLIGLFEVTVAVLAIVGAVVLSR